MQMKRYQTICDKWTNDFRKIIFCAGIVLFGTVYNFNEPKAFAVAVMVQGASNIDSFWEYLESKQICTPLKILSFILIFLSTAAMFYSFFLFGKINRIL